MSTKRWQLLKDIIDAASQLPTGARAAYLREACAGDAALLAEAESLLAADEQAERFVERAVEVAVEAWVDESSPVGRRLGAYEVVRELGHGGMGSVFLAARVDDEYRKEVAVKVVRAGADGPDSRRRFRVERQILANLEHPNIARLLDGGTTDDQLPYVVMEYVDGEPLTAYCDRKRLTIDERLQLFERVCLAVEFAHRNLVVHRDLKPGNILVTADGTPKLLDFGIAKLLDEPDGAPATRTAFRPMTMAYASPEQVRGGVITTATDVYALGVLLCELLSGRRPYRVDDRNVMAVEDAITTQAPERPSTAVFRTPVEDRESHSPGAIAAARSTTPEGLRRRLSGDLDVITLAALRKEPERRYGSVEQLSQDVRRHLDGRPVKARPDTFGYRTGKFVLRHRGAVTAAAATVLLVAGLTAFYGARLANERDRARAEGEKAAQVATFLQDLFQAADPAQAQGREVTARELLDVGAGRVERELSRDPVLQATMMGVIGRVYQSLGDYEDAASFLEAAEAQWRASAEDSLERAVALHDLGSLANVRGEHAEAASLLSQAYELRRKHLPSPHEDLVRTRALQGSNETRRGDFPRAEVMLEEAVAMGRELPSTSAGAEVLAQALSQLGRLRSEQSRYDEALLLLREALDLRRRVLGDDHPSLGDALSALAGALLNDRQLDEAETVAREAVAHAQRILGDDHPTVTVRLGSLAQVLNALGRHEEAGHIHRDVLARYRDVLGPLHPNVASALNNLGTTLKNLGHYDEAVTLYLESLDVRRVASGDEHPAIATVLNNLAHALAEKRDFVEAERYQREALAMDRKLLGDDHVYVGMDLSMIGIYLLADGQVGPAEAPLRQGYEVFRKALGDDHPTTAGGLYAVATYLAAAGRLEEGEAAAREVIRVRRTVLPEGHWETALAETLLGDILAGQGRDAEAEPLLVNGFEIVKAQPIGSRNRTDARERVVRFFLSRGQPDRAAAVPQ